MSTNILYNTYNCPKCGGFHKGRPLVVTADEQFIVCPITSEPIYDYTKTWYQDTAWSKLNRRVRDFNYGAVLTIGLLTMLIGIPMAGCPRYKVWTSEMLGNAELARATSNRMIAVQEAEAKMEAAVKLAQAEITRAGGIAKANEIIGDSLKGNDAYLRYLWIESLHTNPNSQVVYVPTEANLPILEANRKVK